MPDVVGAGGVLWQDDERAGLQIAVIHRPRYDDWSLPKGKARTRESLQQTAVREIAEETGYACVLSRMLAEVRYQVVDGRKQVTLFSAQAGDGEFAPSAEVDRLKWLSPAKAAARLDHADDVAAVAAFTSLPTHLRTLTVVRHGKAGERESFDGNDLERPLDEKGTAQADALGPILASYGPEQVRSAPATRCVQTVTPAADLADLSICIDEQLGEDVYRDDPGAARRLIRMLLADGREARQLLCSQGGVIPGAVRSLAADSRLTVPDVSTPKAAHWVLSFAGDRLVQADRHPAPVVTVHR